MPYKNKEDDLACRRRSYQRRKIKVLTKNKAYRLAHPEKFAAYSRIWRLKYPERWKLVQLKSRKKRRANSIIRERMNIACSKWQKNNRDYINAYHRKYARERKLINPIYKLRRNMSSRIRQILKSKGFKKKYSGFDIIGCSVERLKSYLEKQFKPGMTWDNYGKEWHVDHGVPLGWFKDEHTLLNRCHFTNLKPMWKLDNMKKGMRWMD